MADVKPLQSDCLVADVIASGRWINHKVNYFNFSSEVLNRTSSQTSGKWYLPTFLLRGWIIYPYVQSLFYDTHLVQVLPPNNVNVVNGNIVTSGVAMVIYGRGGEKKTGQRVSTHSLRYKHLIGLQKTGM